MAKFLSFFSSLPYTLSFASMVLPSSVWKTTITQESTGMSEMKLKAGDSHVLYLTHEPHQMFQTDKYLKSQRGPKEIKKNFCFRKGSIYPW